MLPAGRMAGRRREKKMKIGVMDSGIGGLTLLEAGRAGFKGHTWLYYADTAHVPYGVKPKEEIQGYVMEGAAFLAEQGIEVLVVACNTATSVAIELLREKLSIPVIGMEPAVKPALHEVVKPYRVLVTATPLTLREEKFRNLLLRYDEEHVADALPLPGLVELGERGVFSGDEVESYLRQAFSPFQMGKYQDLVLGCTHFNYFKEAMRKILPKTIRFVDGVEGTLQQLARQCPAVKEEMSGGGKTLFFESGHSVSDGTRLQFYQTCLEHLKKMRSLD